MKRFLTKYRAALFLMTVMLASVFAACALAETAAIDPEAQAALQAAHPGYTFSSPTKWGDTAAAVLSEGNDRILCLAEKQNGAWRVVIDNPNALRRDVEGLPRLYLDTDTYLIWTYPADTLWSYAEADYTLRYDAMREDGEWQFTSYTIFNNNTHTNTHLSWCKNVGGVNVFRRIIRHEDENENLIYESAYIPVPADWFAPYEALAAFDCELFPDSYGWTDDWANETARRGAAEQLMPEYTYRGGTLNFDSMQFLMEKPNGALVFVGVSFTELTGWLLTESTPLPEGTKYGRDNFSSSLYISDDMLADIKRFGDGSWGVGYLYSTPANGDTSEMICFGQHWIADEVYAPEARYYGDHPWGDITAMDWTSLPHSLEEAVGVLDNRQWAVVNNPNPEDRLHLRVSPERGAASLGKYYNGTPVRILRESDDWVYVSLYGVEGYMMKQYLAFGDAMSEVTSVSPSMTAIHQPLTVYQSPQGDIAVFTVSDESGCDLRIRGIVGEEWFHVWVVSTEQSGYVRQSDMRAEND